ncbi:regulatory subunit of cyclin-dependent kinase [Papiliotrema laurentii]|uniref:Cyclin-dependent kinases regulatory subunit n=1 Tax=Papiliotrema laurentii TaxID=5418 RepID=A0AAD9FPH0_PAPLA|nr:regulatory subunit of cyclin-dependent kinase [Papiliotrema laurentii]
MSKYTQKPFTAEEKRKAIEQYSEKIQYSPRYSNDAWEYRHVIIPKQLVRYVPPGICSEDIWRGLGIRQSPGWEMYMRHDPEPVRVVPPYHSWNPFPPQTYLQASLHHQMVISLSRAASTKFLFFCGAGCHVLLFRRPKDYDVMHAPFGMTGAARTVNVMKK